jgi:hypothetical protein
MTEEQAQTIIKLLVEVNKKLSEINSAYDLGDVCSKLDSAVSKLKIIEDNTAN